MHISLLSLSTLLNLAAIAQANPLSKVREAIHGSGIYGSGGPKHGPMYLPSTLEPRSGTHTLEARAGISNVAPNITDRSFINNVLSRTDLWREQHGALPMVWSTTLAQYALDQANKCELAHSGGPYGENIYWTNAPSINHLTNAKRAIDLWGEEYKIYNTSDPTAEPALHFTALVWKNAKKIGCAWTSTTCTNTWGGFFFFCEMEPVTNVVGRFEKNVDPVHREIGTYTPPGA